MEIKGKRIVVSGINIFEGGPLSVMQDFLAALAKEAHEKRHKVTVFVHRRDLYVKYCDAFEIIELPSSRKSYLYRLYYEYIYFYWYSIQEKIDVWISMHDMTPNVKAYSRYVYCHNATPFLTRSLNIWKYSKKTFFMTILYKYIYRINIKKNSGIIVQQEWLRKKFVAMFGVNNIIVAKPSIPLTSQVKPMLRAINHSYTFIYSAFPRPFKNFEIICEACEKLIKYELNFKVFFTIDGTENTYSRDLVKRYSFLETIKWLGLLEREDLLQKYVEADCMIFPSLLESWGLPITEFKKFGKPLLCADLPYAYETVGNYSAVTFFDPYDSETLASIMQRIIEGKHVFSCSDELEIPYPHVNSWGQLIEMILS